MDIQSVGTLVSGMAKSNLQQAVGIAVLGKSLDSMQIQGQMLTQLMEQSAQPHLGGNLDIRA